jgi:hypothetical protein
MSPVLPVIPPWILRSSSVLVYTFALWKGSIPERALAALCAALWFEGNVVHPSSIGDRPAFELAKDSLVCLFTLALATRFDRWWLLVAGMATLLGVATDAAGLIVPVHRWAIGTAHWIWGYLLYGALTAGAWASWRRRSAAPEPAPA